MKNRVGHSSVFDAPGHIGASSGGRFRSSTIIATTLDYPMIMDTFGCAPKFLSENPKAAKALADGYFEALEMI